MDDSVLEDILGIAGGPSDKVQPVTARLWNIGSSLQPCLLVHGLALLIEAYMCTVHAVLIPALKNPIAVKESEEHKVKFHCATPGMVRAPVHNADGLLPVLRRIDPARRRQRCTGARAACDRGPRAATRMQRRWHISAQPRQRWVWFFPFHPSHSILQATLTLDL